MKKNEIFTFTAPNGVEVAAIVVAEVSILDDQRKCGEFIEQYLCYSQNRLFSYIQHMLYNGSEEPLVTVQYFDKTLIDYAILPDYDVMLERFNDIEVAQTETQSGM